MEHAIRPQPMPPAVQALLGFIAGFVDVVAFLGLFKIYVAQLTGSFVFAGAELVSLHHELTAIMAIPAFFLAGCLATALGVSRAGGGRPFAVVLALECVLLTAMLLIVLTGNLSSADSLPVIEAALLGIAAMGVQSAMVRLFLPGAPSTNVMTTNTSQLAIDATVLLLSLTGRIAEQQVTASCDRLMHYWPPVAGFVLGTAAGALGEREIANVALIVPVVLAYALLAWAARRGPALS